MLRRLVTLAMPRLLKYWSDLVVAESGQTLRVDCASRQVTVSGSTVRRGGD